MPGPIDYNTLAQMLMAQSLIQPVGTVLPFQKKTPTGEVMRMPEVGPMGGRVVPFGGPTKPTDARLYSDAIAKQQGRPQELRRGGPWPIRTPDLPQSHKDMLKSLDKIKDDKWRKYLEDKIKSGQPLFSWER